MTPTPITIIQGAQWGSEAKGMVAGALAIKDDYDYAVRTGSINAGHTVYYKDKPYAMQQIPVAWVNPRTRLVIGPGAYVHMPTLQKEIAWISEATGEDARKRIIIDERAGVHLDTYTDDAKKANRHHKIGATGKGCAEAIIDKIKSRGLRDLLFWNVYPDTQVIREYTDSLITDRYFSGDRIMIEGTQGELLDFHLGPWPYVTSRQTTAAAWVAEAGLSPSLRYDIVLVARTYPIRVAGNSGPMPFEMSWVDLAKTINTKLDQRGFKEGHPMYIPDGALDDWAAAVKRAGGELFSDVANNHLWTAAQRSACQELLSEYAKEALEKMSPISRNAVMRLFETTTVTKKLRRIARPDFFTLRETVRRLRPRHVAVTFLNYEFPELYGTGDPLRVHEEAREYARMFGRGVGEYNVTRYVTTGPKSEHLIAL